MPAIDTLITRYMMDNKDYVRGANDVESATSRMATGMQGAIDPLRKVAEAIAKVVLGYAALNVAVLAFGAKAYGEFASYDARVKALEAIEGSAKKAEAALILLRESAKAPGLEIQEAIDGYAQFRRLGLSQAASIRVVDAAGTANALGGGNGESFGSILRALRQIITKPKVSAEEINQLEEAGVPVRGMMKEKYGTADPEQLSKIGVSSTQFVEDLVKSWEGGAKALDSAQNRMDNLKSAWIMSLVSIGDGINDSLTGPMADLSTSLEEVTNAGVFKNLGDAIGGLALGLTGLEDGSDDLSSALVMATGWAAGFVQTLDAVNRGLLTLMTNPLVQFLVSMSPVVTGIQDLFDASGMQANIRAQIEQAQMEMELARKRNKATDPEGDPRIDKDENPPPLKPPSKADKHLEGIEKNTAALVQNFEDYAFGGGELGQQLTSPVNLSRIGRKSSDPLEEAMALIREYVGIEVMRNRGARR